MTTLSMLWHEWRHGTAWRTIAADRPTRAHGTLFECQCGKRWLARAPWFRQGGF